MAVGDLFAQPDILSLVQQGAENGEASAPLPPEKHAENKGLWKNFLSKLQEPNTRQALFQTGLNLMRSPGYGQSNWDIAANALGAGANTLQTLREHDRVVALQAQEHADREKQQQTENEFKGRQVGATEQNAQAYSQQVKTQGEESMANREEKKRSAEATAEINRYKAETERMRAKAYMSFSTNRVPADIQKINILAAKYMKDDASMSEEDAKSKATELLEFGARNEPISKVARDLYKKRLDTYANSIEGLKKPPTAQLQQFMMEEAQRDAQKLIDLNQPGLPGGGGGTPPAPSSNPRPAPTPAPVPGGAPSSPNVPPTAQSTIPTSVPTNAPAPVAPPPGPSFLPGNVVDPGVKAKVDLLRNRGIDPAIIKQALIQGGVDPALYGVQ